VEYGTIEKRVRIDASPQVVYDVVSRPEHIRQWWAQEADFEPVAGASGAITFGNESVRLTVIEAVPPTRFRYYWHYREGTTPGPSNGTLVTFEIAPDGDGAILTVVEEGMREQGWEAAKLEDYYADHAGGWAACLDRLIPAYIERLLAA
jgi:uncharacterized protein YndB with AHSA1/START domain